MTKFAKLSLVAAIAVTSLSAVDFSGYATYRFNNDGKDANEYKAALTAKQKVSDDFTAAVGVSVRSVDTTTTLGASDDKGNDTVAMNAINFTYTGVPGLTVIAGRQALNTPWTEGSSVINGTQQGNGVLGLYNAGFATFAAAHFTNNNITDLSKIGNFGVASVADADLNVAAAIVPLSSIGATAQAWLIQVGAGNAITKETNAASYNLAGKVSGVSYDARYSTMTVNDAKENSLMKVVASTNIAGIDFTAGYGKTGTDGGYVAFDNDGDASFGVEIANLNGLTDTKAILLGAAYNVLPNVNASVSYLDISGQSTDKLNDANEIDAALTYTASKNMTAKVVYAQLSADTKADDKDLTRIELAYKF